jgi:hypothetical protein
MFIRDQIEPKSLEEPEQDASDTETNVSSVDAMETSTDITTPSSSYKKDEYSEPTVAFSPTMPNHTTTESVTSSTDTTTMS